jgi:formamidopyrimidine-DNA glycosylase
MPELPDIVVLARSMEQALNGKTIVQSEVNQPKVLNLSVANFKRRIKNQTIEDCQQRGKWVLINLEAKWTIGLNLGMGGNVRLHGPDEKANPKRERVVLKLDDGNQVWIHFWWFGHVHFIPKGNLEIHPQIAKLGIEPLSDSFTVDTFTQMLERKKGRIKSYLLDQSFIAGIGNVYIQDILWHARLHPNRKADTLESGDITRLHKAIKYVLKLGIKLGGSKMEFDIWGNEGGFWKKLKVGYRTGKPCPKCKTTIEEIRVGSTTSYICPQCQK